MSKSDRPLESNGDTEQEGNSDFLVTINPDTRAWEKMDRYAEYHGEHRCPIYADYDEHNYREVLNDYERYMITYDSLASNWPDHYRKIQQSIDEAMGLKRGKKISEAEEKTLRSTGIIALFGCGYNPTRELSPKMLQALKDKMIDVVLVDFSKYALKTAINFLNSQNIQPKAAYQMDLSGGAATYLRTFITEHKRHLGGNLNGKLEVFLDEVIKEAEALMQNYKYRDERIPGNSNRYLMHEGDRPGLAVSTMVAAATFLTVYEGLQKIVSAYSEYLSPAERESHMRKIQEMHARYNAFVMGMNSAKMANLCRDKGRVLIITDVNKISYELPEETNGNVDEEIRKKQAETVARIRASVEDRLLGNPPEESDLLPLIKKEIRMSRIGALAEPLEDIVRDPFMTRKMVMAAIDEFRSNQGWMWWDDPRHGHEVRTVAYEVAKNKKIPLIGILSNLPREIESSEDPERAAMFVRTQIKEQIRALPLYSKSAADLQETLTRLANLKLPDIEDFSDELMESHKGYVCKAGRELLSLVSWDTLATSWKEVHTYLIKERNWKNDDITRGHIKAGMHWLKKFVAALKAAEEKDTEDDS